MPVYCFEGATPSIHESAYLADSATLIGKVTLGPDTSIWSQAVLRADNEPIVIGEGSNIQEGCVLHCDPGYPLTVGVGVTVGHQATLHGCSIGSGTLIGLRAAVLNGAVIGSNCIVGAGSLVTEGKVFPDGMLILGTPAKAVRELTAQEIQDLESGARDYVRRAQIYKMRVDRLA